MIEKLKTLLLGDTDSKKLAVLLANQHTDNPQIMTIIDGLALESSKKDIKVFFEILEQDYAEKLPTVAGLRTLCCSKYGFECIPESIGKLEKLKELSCSCNELTSLPESIGKLKKLEKLYCLDNKLTFLPESIGELVNLKILDCHNNQLTSLLESIGKL